MALFIPTTSLPLHRFCQSYPRFQRHTHPRSSPFHQTPTATVGRSPWPLSRFVKTVVFYSPLGKFFRGNQPDPSASFRERKRAPSPSPSSPSTGLVLVTGASGGLGRRVVRELLRNGKNVRAMTRNEERLLEALKAVGVEMNVEIEKGNLEIFVTDLFNVRNEMFENVVTIISCTGVTVGPKEDKTDRSKYYQGVVFYEPCLLDSTPENVEYVGIRNLVKAAKEHFARTLEQQIPVLMFSDEAQIRAQWGVLDDVVMGGVSSCSAQFSGKDFVFRGFVSTDNFGGFSSLRTVNFESPMDLSEYEGLALRVQGDGNRYKLNVRCEEKWDGVAYCQSFATKRGEWIDVPLPFSEFVPLFRGRTVRDGKLLDRARIFSFQIMISKFEYDGELNKNFFPGPFELRMTSLNAYKGSSKYAIPKFVHVGAAGSTQVLRADEFSEADEQPKPVILNEMLGRIYNWKLAGEDEIRMSGIPYCIIRPCAMTEDEALGFDKLMLFQGDNTAGQISRNDMANFIMKTIECEEMKNVTTEVRQVKDGEVGYAMVDEQIRKLVQDDVTQRKFATFPYIPSKG